jgi:hypothetical protein
MLKEAKRRAFEMNRFDRQPPTIAPPVFVTGGVGCERPSAGFGTRALDLA